MFIIFKACNLFNIYISMYDLSLFYLKIVIISMYYVRPMVSGAGGTTEFLSYQQKQREGTFIVTGPWFRPFSSKYVWIPWNVSLIKGISSFQWILLCPKIIIENRSNHVLWFLLYSLHNIDFREREKGVIKILSDCYIHKVLDTLVSSSLWMFSPTPKHVLRH